jgi:hypothetical protein
MDTTNMVLAAGHNEGDKEDKKAQETLTMSLGPIGKSFLHVHFIFFGY